MTTGPRPMTPPECDVRDYPRMLVDIKRLFESQFNLQASRLPLAWMIGFKLWCRSFHQVPGGSLPIDEGDLCQLAELGLDLRTFRKARDLALRGWVQCSDGRLYHRVVAETVLEAWVDKLLLQQRSGLANSRRHKGFVFDPAPILLNVETAGVYLADLNPRARGLEKIRRRSSSDADAASKTTPTRTPQGGEREATRAPPSSQAEAEAEAEAQGEDSSLRSETLPCTLHGSAQIESLGKAAVASHTSLLEQLFEAAGSALATGPAAAALLRPGAIIALLEPAAGPACDLEADVLPTVRRLSARAEPGSVEFWAYYVDATVERRDARLRGDPVDEPKPRTAKRGSRIPDTWSPSKADLEFAVGEGLTPEEVAREADRFGDYWRSRTGAGGAKQDWAATWRNWVRKTADERRGSITRMAARPSLSGRHGSGVADFASIVARSRFAGEA